MSWRRRRKWTNIGQPPACRSASRDWNGSHTVSVKCQVFLGICRLYEDAVLSANCSFHFLSSPHGRVDSPTQTLKESKKNKTIWPVLIRSWLGLQEECVCCQCLAGNSCNTSAASSQHLCPLLCRVPKLKIRFRRATLPSCGLKLLLKKKENVPLPYLLSKM